MFTRASVQSIARHCCSHHNHFFVTFSVTTLRMGNSWPSRPMPLVPSKVEHPKWFGTLPAPYPIGQIAPELLVYVASPVEFSLLINSHHSAKEAAQLLTPHLESVDRLVILTHGFLASKNTSWLHALKDAIMQTDTRLRQVVAILGWGHGADIGVIRYSKAAANALETGKWLGDILRAVKRANATLQVYGVGHSLGAHLMGNAGRTSRALTRITGLDPAGPGFQDSNLDKRLAKTDAPLVDVIHTDGQDVPYFGTLVPLGLIDFYPNFGWNQPTKDRAINVKPSIEMDVNHRKVAQESQYGETISESHSRSIEFFTWSVRNSRAFRTNLRLDGTPDVELAVHRVACTGSQGDAEVSVEMGYHGDAFIEAMIAEMTGQGGGCTLRPKVDDQPAGKEEEESITLADFAGNYYVHTNATAPWR